jgi:hypothetical protein
VVAGFLVGLAPPVSTAAAAPDLGESYDRAAAMDTVLDQVDNDTKVNTSVKEAHQKLRSLADRFKDPEWAVFVASQEGRLFVAAALRLSQVPLPPPAHHHVHKALKSEGLERAGVLRGRLVKQIRVDDVIREPQKKLESQALESFKAAVNLAQDSQVDTSWVKVARAGLTSLDGSVPAPTGELAGADRRAVTNRLAYLKYELFWCTRHWLSAQRPAKVTFTLLSTGIPTAVAVTSPNSRGVNRCLTRTIGRWRFGALAQRYKHSFDVEFPARP